MKRRLTKKQEEQIKAEVLALGMQRYRDARKKFWKESVAPTTKMRIILTPEQVAHHFAQALEALNLAARSLAETVVSMGKEFDK
jgi:hypothetical protein